MPRHPSSYGHDISSTVPWTRLLDPTNPWYGTLTEVLGAPVDNKAFGTRNQELGIEIGSFPIDPVSLHQAPRVSSHDVLNRWDNSLSGLQYSLFTRNLRGATPESGGGYLSVGLWQNSRHCVCSQQPSTVHLLLCTVYRSARCTIWLYATAIGGYSTARCGGISRTVSDPPDRSVLWLDYYSPSECWLSEHGAYGSRAGRYTARVSSENTLKLPVVPAFCFPVSRVSTGLSHLWPHGGYQHELRY